MVTGWRCNCITLRWPQSWTWQTAPTIPASRGCSKPWWPHWTRRWTSLSTWCHWPACSTCSTRQTSQMSGLCSPRSSTPSVWYTAPANTTTAAPGTKLIYLAFDSIDIFLRIIVLLTETCNLLIEMARGYLDPASIFQIEVCTLVLRWHHFLCDNLHK